MQLHQLQPVHKLKKRRRIGRGGKRGNYSGRGIKGQKSRSGHRIKPAEREMLLKIPKLRGFKNKPLSPKPAVINLSDLEKLNFKTIDKKSLISAGLIRKRTKTVKILGTGNITKAFQIKGLAISQSARQKIEAANGEVLTKI